MTTELEVRRRGNGEIMQDSDEPRSIVPTVPVQQVKTKYTTAMAVQQPRELKRVETRALEEAGLLGADGFYSWGKGKDAVEGPSKDLAMTLVRAYGNCAVDLGEVQETRDAWIFTAFFVDLETGFTLSRQFRQSKAWTVYGKFDDARKDDIRFQIGQSKAVRNVILNALPGWLVRRALDKCKGGVREAIEAAIEKHGIDKVQSRAIEGICGKHRVPEPNLLHAMGRKNVASLTLEDLVILAAAKAQLDSGAETPEDLFPAPPAAEDAKPKGKKADALASKLGAAPDPAPAADYEPGANDEPGDEFFNQR